MAHRAWRERSGFFIVNEAESAKRNTWVVWEEGGRYPDLIIELLSDSMWRGLNRLTDITETFAIFYRAIPNGP